MGTAESVEGGVGNGARTVAQHASSAAGTVVNEARHAPEQVIRQTQGNPLAAGLVAFGVGMVVASLLPATEAEKRAGPVVKEKLDIVKDEAKELGQELSEAVKDTALDAAEEVKDTAREAADQVSSEAQRATSEVKDEATTAASEIKNDATAAVQTGNTGS